MCCLSWRLIKCPHHPPSPNSPWWDSPSPSKSSICSTEAILWFVSSSHRCLLQFGWGAMVEVVVHADSDACWFWFMPWWMVGWKWIPGRNNAWILFSYDFNHALLLVLSSHRCLKCLNNLIAVIKLIYDIINGFVCFFRVIHNCLQLCMRLTFAKCLRQSLPLLTYVMTLITFWSATGIYLVESRSHLA